MNHAFLVNQRQIAALESQRADARPALAAGPGAGVRDTAVVDVRNWHSMQYWAKWLGVSEQQLVRAARIAGPTVAAIEAHLAERRERRQRKRVRTTAIA